LAYKNGKDYFLVQGVFFVMWALGLMVDGNYDKLSGYLKLIFGLIVIGIISRILLMERPVRKRKLKKLG
jgi:cytochrome c oxidase subunit IV